MRLILEVPRYILVGHDHYDVMIMEALSALLALWGESTIDKILHRVSQRCGALMFSLLLAWTSCWTNNGLLVIWYAATPIWRHCGDCMTGDSIDGRYQDNFPLYVIFRILFVSFSFQHCQTTRWLLNITLILNRCRHSSAAVATVKYECDYKNITGNYFCKMENFVYGEISERSFRNPHPRTAS